MFRPSPSRPRRRIATSPLVISSSPDFPSLQNLESQPPRPPAFKSPTPTTPTHRRLQKGFTSAPDTEPDPVNLSPATGPSVNASHYKISNSDQPRQSYTSNDMAQRHLDRNTARQPLLLSSSPATISQEALTASKYFNKTTADPAKPPAASTDTTSLSADASLNLERAAARRLDWTPPKPKSPIVGEPENGNTALTQSVDEEIEGAGKFSKVLESFRCDDITIPNVTPKTDEEGSAFRKRKLIEAVSSRSERNTSVPSESANSKKKAATKKKPRTITGLATAAYRLASQPDPTSVPEGSQAGAPKAAAEGAAEHTGNLPAKKPTRKRAARAPRNTKKKAPAPPKPILLSPSAALRQVANQDFLFGTSSQLAQEHSPRFLRDLAAAMKHSNGIDQISISTPINSDTIEPQEPKRTLWNAAARDEDGDLFDLGVQELAQKSQDLPILDAHADPFGYVQEASPAGDDSFLNLSDILQPQPQSPSVEAASVRQPSSVSCSQDSGLAPPATETKELAPRPSFELYTDAQLASAVSSYGFKNVRQRGARIALLDKCWQGKQAGTITNARSASTLAASKSRSPIKSGRVRSPIKTPARPDSSLASASQPQEPPPSAQPMSPPKRPRGRPRKTPEPSVSLSSSATICAAAVLQSESRTLMPSTPKRSKAKSSKFVVEIPDSESETNDLDALSASPSSVPDETFSPSQGVDLSLSIDEDTELSMTASNCDKPASFEFISKAITSAPRSKNTNNPSWHEKILIYDPIVLEDLTAWLNCGPLTNAGYDDEVSSGEVKKWCESKSICCLWKVNLRGKERKRY